MKTKAQYKKLEAARGAVIRASFAMAEATADVREAEATRHERVNELKSALGAYADLIRKFEAAP
jgi:hypothetical protein